MPRPAIAARVSPTNPASFNVSVWMATWTPVRSATVSEASMTAGVEPQSSCSLRPRAPPRIWDIIASCETVLPLPRKPMLSGYCSIAAIIRARCQGPGVTVVALEPSAGPVPPPTRVVTPAERASSAICGQMKWTCASTAPAVRMRPLPKR